MKKFLIALTTSLLTLSFTAVAAESAKAGAQPPEQAYFKRPPVKIKHTTEGEKPSSGQTSNEKEKPHASEVKK